MLAQLSHIVIFESYEKNDVGGRYGPINRFVVLL